MWSSLRKTFALAAAILIGLTITLALVSGQPGGNMAYSQAATDFTFVVAGDWDCTGNTDDVVDAMAAIQPELVLGLGDYSYDDTIDCWHNNISGGPDGFRTMNVHDKTHNPTPDTPTTLAMGNHEDANPDNPIYLSNDGRTAFLGHYGLTDGDTYYSFNYKGVHFLVLDPNEPFTKDPMTAQYTFAESDLTAASRNAAINWIVVYFHQPMYSTCSCGGGSLLSLRDAYQELFDRNRVDLVLQGHAHWYERIKPVMYNEQITDQRAQQGFDVVYDDPRGQIYVTVGTGGANLHDQSPSPNPPAIAAFRYTDQYPASEYGFLKVQILNGGKKLVGSFVKANSDGTPGDEKDRFTINHNRDILYYVLRGNPSPGAYDLQGRWLDKVSIGQPVILSAVFVNNRDVPQPFVGIIEVRDSADITVHLTTLASTMKPGSIARMDVSWRPAEVGSYEMRTFAITNRTNPSVLFPGVGTTMIPVIEDSVPAP